MRSMGGNAPGGNARGQTKADAKRLESSQKQDALARTRASAANALEDKTRKMS